MSYIPHQKKLQVIGIIVGILFTSLSFAGQTHATSAASFNAGEIISDAIFTNSSSMNASQIQQFLNSKVPTCDTNGTQTSEYGGGTRAQWAAAHGYYPPFTCLKNYSEGGLSAAQIIYNAAQKYQVNPQVLIVLLQKEQGLVTDTWPTSNQYKSATGYGCPDSTPGVCSSQYYGFTNQIANAANMYHQIMIQSPNWYSPYTLGNNSILWNPNTACGSSTVTIKNLATVALYDYTPYRPNQAALNAGYGTGDGCSAYGNRNFFLYFSDWFGSTYSPEPVGAQLYGQQSTGRIYLVTDNTRYYVPSWDMLTNYGLDKYGITTVSDQTIQNLTDGGNLTSYIWDSGGVYLVNNGARYHMTSAMCTAWGVNCLDSSVVKGLGTLFQTGNLTQGHELTNLASYNGTTYKLDQGKRSPIANTQTLKDLGLYSTFSLAAVNANMSQPLGPLLITTPAVIQFSPSPAIYYYNGTTYYQVSSTAQYNDWNLSTIMQLRSPPQSAYNAVPPVATALVSWVKNGPTRYIVDHGMKLNIPSDLSTLWSDSQYTSTPPATLFASLPSGTLSHLVSSGPDLYTLQGGQKRHIPTYNDYIGIQRDLGLSVMALSTDKLPTVPQGNDVFANGKLIYVDDGSGKIYVVSNNQLIHIAGSSVFDAYGFDWSAIITYPSSILSNYPVSTSSLDNAVDQNGTVYIDPDSTLYTLSATEARDYGVKNTTLTTIHSSVASTSQPKQLSHFLYNKDDGRIYYASGGAIHYVSTYSAFVAYGGLRTSATTVTSSIISLFNIGQIV